LLIWFALVGFSCSSLKTTKSTKGGKGSPDITLLRATVTPWSSGIKKDNNGEDYKISVVLNQDSISLESMCVKGTFLDLKYARNGQFLGKENPLFKSDTISITASYDFSRDQKKCKISSEEGYLNFTLDGMSKILIIRSFVKQEALRKP
tara:strand:- start:23514 stop:23960 length:447 start_codon:yes stop_codon:yes gene_type:complete